MSAILGLFYRDQQPLEPLQLIRMHNSLQHRGPHGGSTWNGPSVGLGHQMSHTTPESVYEQLPHRNKLAGLVITADARIDNREELITRLQLTNRPARLIGDSEIILAAYERWGEDCPDYLLGDFAFAIWNDRQQTLFCARDHFGVRPLYYYLSEHMFAFGSEIKALSCLSEIQLRLNELYIADYLANIFGDAKHTCYEHILRLAPGHSISVAATTARMQKYYALDPRRQLQLGSDAEYAEAFQALFTEAVRCRMRRIDGLGATLSGGLDSSSVVCVARALQIQQSDTAMLPTFSLVYKQVPECDESQYIQSVVAEGALQPYSIAGDGYGMLHELERLIWHLEEPFHGQGLATSWPLYARAHAQGVGVMLVGHDGDTAVSHGHGLLAELAYKGHWIRLAREVQALLPLYPMPFWQAFGPLIWRYGLEARLVQLPAPMPVRRVWRNLRSQFEGLYIHRRAINQEQTLINSDFAQRVDLAAYRRQVSAEQTTMLPSERNDHYESLVTPIQPLALEQLNKLGAAHQIDIRYPFWDRRLIEFCLALPGEQKLDHGRDRIVMRRAMQGILPPQVQWRQAKVNFLMSNLHSLHYYDKARLHDLLFGHPGQLSEYINLRYIQSIYQKMTHSMNALSALEVVMLCRAAIFSAWLRRNQVFSSGLSGALL